ncbi:hypothetical protein CONLIGDRAFT_626340 [Coniochaeta ligniaria NRRL 30616]|uniref:Heterokaryon incompatibility domain-containing protein n=1 Tax=Coniochaeta ligniaria NRRL 30616 TaxID=1408157 RepID=A0A1J7JW66_9PEZI|nr:hypothetical protein CONLIGDRAFT_626340 [Coniochaeta ligniaria NRRL 30616]
MRLINVETMKMEEFYGSDIPLYLILSHTWTAEEISFQDYMWLLNHEEEVAEGIIDELPPKQRARVIAKAEALCQRSGYKKVLSFVKGAHQLLEQHMGSFTLSQAGDIPPLYVWVDTCCINKESSAELSEAINSMYEWYKRAHLCVAILSDVAGTESDPHGEFGKSRWFSRGWTLQELIAPVEVVFYNGTYELIGSRSKLTRSIAAVTSIDEDYLLRFGEGRSLSHATVAERMSWAAKRKTTRLEDEAYCLLGIFGVNMPLIYGEGAKAFARLQLEIIKASEDQTIFAWGYNRSVQYWSSLGVFAPSVSHFSDCGRLAITRRLQSRQDTNPPFEMTNIGLRINLSLFKVSEGIGKIYAILPVADKGRGHICVPVTWREPPQGPIHNIPNGAVIDRLTQEQPVACNTYGLLVKNLMAVVERSVILRSVPQPGHGPPWADPSSQFTVAIKFEPWNCALETWAPNVEVDPYGEPGLGMIQLRGSSNKYQWNDWPLFVRARSLSPTAKEELIAISFSITPVRVNWIRKFDWDSIRGLATPAVQSLLGLYVSSLQPGGPEMRSASWPQSSSKGGIDFRLKSIRWRSPSNPGSPLATDLVSPEFSFTVHNKSSV